MAQLYFLQDQYDEVEESIKGRMSFGKSLGKCHPILRGIAECLEAKGLAKILGVMESLLNQAEKDVKTLKDIAARLLQEDNRLHKLSLKTTNITDKDIDPYYRIYKDTQAMSSVLSDMWDKVAPNLNLESDPDWKSRKFKDYENLFDKVYSPENYGPWPEDWMTSDTLTTMVRENAKELATVKIAVKTKPSFPNPKDTQAPTNQSLWDSVLEVASGQRMEMRQGDRVIHSPNNGRGYRNMPHNPNGIAWAVKQYKGFGGNWKNKSAGRLPQNPDTEIVRRVVDRYKGKEPPPWDAVRRVWDWYN